MQTSTQALGESMPLACDACGTKNVSGARFCKHCGAALVPPPQCPACQTTVPNDARFCSSCGAKLVGARPGRGADVQAEARRAPAPPAATASQLASSAAALSDRKRPRSNIVANVLMFVAALAVFVAIMYAVNKDAPKQASMFGGPPPAGQMANRMQEQPSAAAQAVQGAPVQGDEPAAGSIKGTVSLSANLTAPSGGTLFLIARMAGMPAAGPPVAVKRIDSPRFPVEFELGPENVMMQGVPFNGPFAINAKFSQSGNAMAPQPGDLAMTQPKAPVSPGDNNVELVLDKRL